MSEITRLENADIEKRADCVIVTTRTAGNPSSPQPATRKHMPSPRDGHIPLAARVEQLYQQLIREFTNENGE